MAKVKEIGPPTPISPANMAPIFVSGESKPVEFSWTADGQRRWVSFAHFTQPVLFFHNC